MNPIELKKLFPQAGESFIRANCGTIPLPPPASSHVEAMARNKALEIKPTTDEEKLNKLERKYLAWAGTMKAKWVGVQCITLKLGHDCRYTPDFWILDDDDLRAVDTKGGFTREDSIIKIRVAARMFPFIRFQIARLDGGVWTHQDYRP